MDRPQDHRGIVNQAELIFDPTGEKVRENLTAGPVGQLVRRFCIGRMRSTSHREFHGSELYRYVLNHEAVAPDTPRRVLSLLREHGQLDYEVVNRAKSLYRILGVRVSGTEILGRIRPDGRFIKLGD